MGRRKQAAAFSLFSFQDIITSVTAILILVMLLLSIELVSRRRQQAATDPDTTRRQMEATVARLESLTAGLREEVMARRAKRPVRSREAAQRELARVREEFEATRRRHDETLETHVTVTKLRKDAEAVADARAGDVEKLDQLERQAEVDRQQADRVEDSNRKEKDRQAKRKSEIADTPRSGTELVYNPQADSNRRAWLVELSAAGITAVLLGGDRKEKLGADVSDGSTAARWIDELTPDGDYCLLLLRPSTPSSLEEEVSVRLRDKGIRYGVDLIGEEQAVRDGTKTGPRKS
jgi:hypothetical protein